MICYKKIFGCEGKYLVEISIFQEIALESVGTQPHESHLKMSLHTPAFPSIQSIFAFFSNKN